MQRGAMGFFGKLPGMGDFVQRRLPPAFVAAWDSGFEAAIDAARVDLGDAWHAVWAQAPAWRFALSPGVCGEQAWVGVTGPAVDRVGRGFPMVLAHAAADTAVLARMAGAGGGWFALAEAAYRHACADTTMTAETFDAAVLALPDPLEWLDDAALFDSSLESWTDTLRMAWRQVGEDHQLAALWTRCSEAADACMWWTRGGPRMPPTVLLTHGLPEPAGYVAFLDATRTPSHWQSQGAFAAPPSCSGPAPAMATTVAPLPDALDDVFSDLLAPTIPAVTRTSDAEASVPMDMAEDVTLPFEGDMVGPVMRWRTEGLTIIAADNGPSDPRRSAAALAGQALADPSVSGDMVRMCDCLSSLHPRLRERREDLIDPVSEDGAIVIAHVAAGNAELLRVGAAGAWHWRRGQLRPLFDGRPLDAEADTARPGDLTSVLPNTSAPPAPGLGAAEALHCEQVDCVIETGDRLLLLATDTLVRLPMDTLAEALRAASTDEACARIAAAAGLCTDRAQWPVAVIEAGTT